MQRRSELIDKAVDYVLAKGLLGLTLRPLAAAIGTSDRMLIYHFQTKEQLIAEVLDRAQERLAQSMSLPGDEVRTLADLVAYVWQALRSPAAAGVTRLYVETCLLAVREPQQWHDAPARLREPWRAPLRTGLAAFGVGEADVDALADLILDTLDGLALDRMTASDPARADAASAMFGSLLDRSTHSAGPSSTKVSPAAR